MRWCILRLIGMWRLCETLYGFPLQNGPGQAQNLPKLLTACSDHRQNGCPGGI
jgi:hypothetical protein